MPPQVGGAGNTTPGKHAHLRTVCYLAGWARTRQDPVQFHPEDLDTSLCTHVIFAFALLDQTGLVLVPEEPLKDPEMYRRLTLLKRERPSMKVLLAVGGWSMGSEEFTKTVSSEENIHAMALNAVEYLHRYGFDGLDIDWEYPGDRGSPAGDRHRFTSLLQVLRQEFNRDHHVTKRNRLLLSVAVSPSPDRIRQSYELPELANYVDFISALTYDLHGQWEDKVGHHSALYSSTQDEKDSIDYLINWILNTSIPRQKLNLGLAFYGRSFNLSDAHNTQVGAPQNGPGAGGELLGDPGVMVYYEVCKLLTEHNDTITEAGRLPGTQAPYVVDGVRWTGYDDVESIKEKVDYAVQKGLGGVSIWSIDMDDFHGICGGGHYPLMNAIREQLHTSLIG
ncbi:chitotriosidase-1-like [Babylonia areolata]|uniref:chitotriosidase-1-like n=1 Tax=Babylonia areolata TaxID=304850 RepID=UPI003FD1CC99